MKSGVNVTFRIPVWLDKICTWPLMIYRKRRYGQAFRRIYLGENEWTILDPRDYYRFANYKWCLNGNGTSLYVIRHVKIGPKKTKIVSLHREILNAPAGFLVDHKNCDSQDNTRSNLRLATRSQNQCNKKKTRTNTSSKFIGVSFNKHHKKWLAYIGHEGKKIWLKAFDNEIDAAKAYDDAARKYHGEFARLNFPEDASCPERV